MSEAAHPQCKCDNCCYVFKAQFLTLEKELKETREQLDNMITVRRNLAKVGASSARMVSLFEKAFKVWKIDGDLILCRAKVDTIYREWCRSIVQLDDPNIRLEEDQN